MYDILGIGDAIVDRIVSFDDGAECMRPFLAVKGQFFEATPEQHRVLYALPPEAVYPGGSAANTLRDLSVLGNRCLFFGKVGLDSDAAVFEKSLTDWGVDAHLLKTTDAPTGYCMVIVHDDCDRTLCSDIGASGLLRNDEFKDSLFQNARAVLLEGYQLDVQPQLVLQLAIRAKRLGCAVYFTLSGPHCVRNRRAELLQLLKTVDILFGNEDEFAELNLPAAQLPALSICTKGENGVAVLVDGAWQTFPCEACLNVVNTNGAGDAFCAGFLYRYHQGADIATCVQGGHEIALRVIQSPLAYLEK